MTDHEITNIREVFFSLEDGKPTLWDAEYPGDTWPPANAIRAVYLTNGKQHEVRTDPDIVAAFLDE